MAHENIEMIRGDTLAFGFELDGVTSVDGVYFSVKKTKHDDEYILQKTLNNGIELVESGKYSVRVAPSDTHDLDVGIYYYDLQIGVNGDIFTMLYGTLEIEADITRDYNFTPEKVPKSGCYYYYLPAEGALGASVGLFSFSQSGNDVILLSFGEDLTLKANLVGTYTKTKTQIIIALDSIPIIIDIDGVVLSCENKPLIYKPNFDIDYIKSLFEEG
jgi:hypothetical protein